MDGFETRMLARMPLAEAVMLLWRELTDERRLQAIYQQHRGWCYESVISFPTMVHLVSDALLHVSMDPNRYEVGDQRQFHAVATNVNARGAGVGRAVFAGPSWRNRPTLHRPQHGPAFAFNQRTQGLFTHRDVGRAIQVVRRLFETRRILIDAARLSG